MVQPVKYTFDTAFQATRLMRRQRTTFDLAELEAAKREAYEEGLRDGNQKEQASVRKHEAESLAAIGKALHAIARARTDAHTAAVRDGARLAANVARRFVANMIAHDATVEVEDLLRRCLESLHGEPRIVLRVSAGAFDILGPRIDGLAGDIGFDGRIVLVGDDQLQGSACRVEWADGGAERDDTGAWAELDAAIERATSQPEATAGDGDPTMFTSEETT
ncbi:MAG: hypothetical protein ACREER_06640 [Alphaproteobacteria bacterium]